MLTALVHVARVASPISSHFTEKATMSPGWRRIGVILGSNTDPRTFSSDQTNSCSPLTSSVATPLSLKGFSMRTSVRSNV